MRDVYVNLNYKETKEVKTYLTFPNSLPLSLQVIMPTWTVRRLRLWEEYFLAWDGTSIASRAEIDTGGGGGGLEGPGDVTNQVSILTCDCIVL